MKTNLQQPPLSHLLLPNQWEAQAELGNSHLQRFIYSEHLQMNRMQHTCTNLHQHP